MITSSMIQHNMLAAFGSRQLGIVTDCKAKSTEKLSSGYKINRSADDAAGLSISEETRRLIRGLDQGADNIGDGISLCQIADGALDEVTSVLQRVRELSIQAYNGTNSKSDRNIIQTEVDSCLGEIDEIKERTKFNEIYVLKGKQTNADPVEYVYETEEVTRMVTDPISESRVVPDWLVFNDKPDKSDMKITEHDYVFDQDTSGIMLYDFNYTHGGKTYRIPLYFGENQGPSKNVMGKKYAYIEDFLNKPGSYNPCKDVAPADFLDEFLTQNESRYRLKTYVSKSRAGSPFSTTAGGKTKYEGWTKTGKDNPTCKVDFGGLVDATTDAKSLFKNMSNLLSTEIGIPCGTCNECQAIRFTGTDGTYKTIGFLPNGAYYDECNYAQEISLSDIQFQCEWAPSGVSGDPLTGRMSYDGYFDAINSLYSITDPALQETKAKELAGKIAEDLADRMNSAFNSGYKHFDRSLVNPADKASIYVYDYRDEAALIDDEAADSRIIRNTSIVFSEYTHEVTKTIGHWKKVEPDRTHGLKIQASANSSDWIPLVLEEISKNSLKLDYYNVNYYAREVYPTENYLNKKKAYQEELNNLEYEEYTKKVNMMVMTKPPEKEPIFKMGELDGYKIISPAEYEMREVELKLWRPAPGQKIPEEPKEEWYTEDIYSPSSLDLIDDAMSKVSALRSYFGAQQNRLEHAYANNKNTQENMEAGESRIRDTDMAEEMVRYSKENILAQAGQALLSQSLRTPEGVMRLLG